MRLFDYGLVTHYSWGCIPSTSQLAQLTAKLLIFSEQELDDACFRVNQIMFLHTSTI